MFLAGTLSKFRTDLICDLAEYYHVLNYRALPVDTLAALCAGLREESRVMMKYSGSQQPLGIYLAAAAVDNLSMLVWTKSKDAQKNRNRPESILKSLTGKKDTKPEGFSTAEEFEAARKRIMEG